MNIKKHICLWAVVLCGGGMCVYAHDARSGVDCEYWYSCVDSKYHTPVGVAVDISDEKCILGGIECLLSCEGNNQLAKFSGASNDMVSANIPPARIEVAALYYISYLYYGKWDHAYAVLLEDEHGNENTDESIKKAYKSYRKWFKQVKKIGIKRSRALGLDPLQYAKGVNWY